MTHNTEMNREVNNLWRMAGRRLRGALVLLMGCVAMTAPFFAGTLALSLVGLFLTTCGVLEMLETFRFPDESRQRSTYLSGALSILVGLLLLNKPKFILGGLVLLFAGSFLIDGISKMVAALKARAAGTTWRWTLFTALVNVGLSLVLISRWPISGQAVVAVLVGIRMLVAGWAMVLNREKEPGALTGTPLVGLHPDSRLKLPPHSEFTKLEASQKIEEKGRRSIDAYWCWTFVVLFFAIHIGRMSVDWNLVGMIAPLVAVLGDVGTALVIAFGIILPYRLAGRKLTRPLERRAWQRELARAD